MASLPDALANFTSFGDQLESRCITDPVTAKDVQTKIISQTSAALDDRLSQT